MGYSIHSRPSPGGIARCSDQFVNLRQNTKPYSRSYFNTWRRKAGTNSETRQTVLSIGTRSRNYGEDGHFV